MSSLYAACVLWGALGHTKRRKGFEGLALPVRERSNVILGAAF
jgi:hypothetical protein